MFTVAMLCGHGLLAQQAAIQEAPAQSTEADAQSEYPINEAALKQVTFDIKYMSSDEMGGRQPGTPGIKLCEDYIVGEYKKAGLKPLENGTYFQELEVGNTRIVDEAATTLVLKGPNDTTMSLELGKEFQQLLGRKDFDLNSDLVFAGYGISADEHNYDDFADVDVKDKIVVLIRLEPQANDDGSVFDGAENSTHAAGRKKVTAARRKGAAGILMVNDIGSAGETDELIQADRFQTNSLPFAHLKRSVLNDVLAISPLVNPAGGQLKTVEAIEELVDSNLEPISQALEGWTAEFKSSFIKKTTKTNNIIGIIEGEGPNADETIVIGAHYDHLGDGAYGSRAGGRREIHNGADDNATGTAAVIELARRFAASDTKPGRRLVFVCFTAEEMGLLGAFHYVKEPVVPLEQTAAMVNFDMIGWLRENELTLYNWNSSAQLDPIFESANEGFDFTLKKPSRGGGSDQIAFHQKKIPNVFIHTGQTDVYHTPEDDFETIDCKGALKVIDYSEQVVSKLAAMKTRPTFGVPKPFRLGAMLSDKDEVVIIEGIVEGSLAERAGLMKGDVILEVNGDPLTKRRDMTKIVRRDVGKTIQLKLKREDSEVTLNVELKKKD